MGASWSTCSHLLQLGFTADARGSVSKAGVAQVSGVVTCSRPIGTNVSGTLKQLFANRVYVTGVFTAHVDCVAPSAPWSATVTGDNGKFGSGAATLTVDAFGCELSCHSASAKADVRLNKGK